MLRLQQCYGRVPLLVLSFISLRLPSSLFYLCSSSFSFLYSLLSRFALPLLRFSTFSTCPFLSFSAYPLTSPLAILSFLSPSRSLALFSCSHTAMNFPSLLVLSSLLFVAPRFVPSRLVLTVSPRLPRASDGSTNLLVSLGSTESAITDHSLMQALSGSAPALSMVLADG